MIHYVIQILAFQFLFLLLYDLLLKRETFFQWNRAYLLVTPLLSLLLPFIRINAIEEQIPMAYRIQLPEVLIGGQQPRERFMLDPVTVEGAGLFDRTVLFEIGYYIWITGMILSAGFFIYKCYKVYRLRNLATKQHTAAISYFSIPDATVAFTFLNWIFLGARLSKEQVESILLHEQVHVREKHTLDLIYFELIRIPLWFNPFLYLFQQRAVVLQEFIADARVAHSQTKTSYYQDLLSQVFQTSGVSFTNTFFNRSLIKKRIIMLQKSRSKRIFQLKYLVLLPAIFGMLVYTSCAQEQPNEEPTAMSVSEKIADLKIAIEQQGTLSESEASQLKALLQETPGLQSDASLKRHTEMTFAAIDQVPVYPGCEGLNSDAARKCFTTKVMQYVGANFDTSVSKGSGLSGRQRIEVAFTIDSSGEITQVKAKAEHADLMQEATRVIESLPSMKPGMHNGKVVAVQFAIPIVFEIE